MVVVRNLFLHVISIQLGDLRIGRGWEVDHAKHRPAGRRRNADFDRGAIATTGYLSRSLIRDPYQPGHGAAAGTNILVWVGVVKQHDGFPGLVVAGDDATDCVLLHVSLPALMRGCGMAWPGSR